MHTEVTGAILTGGESRRMGRDKASLDFGGEPLVRKGVRLLKRLFPRVLVVTKEPGRLGDLGCEEIADRFPGRGAMVGVLTALFAAETNYLFVAACDMPFLRKELIDLIVSTGLGEEGVDIVLPKIGGKGDPLHAFYSTKCREAMRSFMEREGRSLNAFVESLPAGRVRYVSEGKIRAVDPHAAALFNMNTPEDYERAKDLV